VICLEDIINQIIQVDSVAFENKKKNEDFLVKKKQEYENKINNYRNEKIATAKKNAELIFENVETNFEKEKKSQEDKIKKISVEMEKKFLQSENDVIKKICNKLFVLE
jgi:phenylalanyl-tRNA synthetase alpha subunit